MTIPDVLVRVAHIAVVVAIVLLVAYWGRLAARRLKQPGVIGEITAGLLLGPVVFGLLGTDTVHQLLPGGVIDALRTIGQIGLALFMVGVARDLHVSAGHHLRRRVGWVATGAFVPSLAAGVLLAGWILFTGDAALRGSAPAASFVLLAAVGMAVTAVPVLARIMAERGIATTSEGRLAMAAGIMIDTIAWLLLALAVALNSGSFAGFVIAMVAMTVGLFASAGIRRLLSSGPLGRFRGRSHRGTAVVIGAAALAGSAVAEQYGLTAIFGAVLIGLAIPGSGESSPWTPAVRSVSRAGQWLLPVFFVTTGLTLLAEPVSRLPWMAIALVTVLGMLSKTAGTYFGARLAGESRSTSARLGALMNTRGLTEIVVLQAGYSAGILTAGLFLAFLVMALATTAATGPLLSFVDRRAARQPALPPPSRSDVL